MSRGYYPERTRIYPHPDDDLFGVMEIAPECYIPGRHLNTGNFDPFTSGNGSIIALTSIESAMARLSEIMQRDGR